MGGGKSPLTTDTFILESDAGISYVCPIVNTSSDSFTVRLADGCETGYYKVFVKRDARKKSFGRIYINIVEDIDFKPDAGTTVYGIVSSAGVGVENVVVSDGAEVTVTNEKGIYQLKSAKKWGYVFISVPSGYEVPSVGVLPQFHRALKNSADVVERADFKLEKVDGQDSYKIFMLGDMHLANRTGDLGQFAQFTSDLTDYMTRHKGEKMYALTLGDMTWDLYWYSNSYYFPQYLNTVNSQIKNLQIFHTMGNHDNDFQTRSDYDAAVKYVDQICPTYYSFNIGKAHFIMLDNTVYLNAGADASTRTPGDHSYNSAFTEMELAWLKADLATVKDKNAPLVIGTHCQVFYYNSSLDITPSMAYGHSTVLDQLLADFTDVHIISGHTHNNTTMKIRNGLMEHNTGGSCATWWWTGYYSNGHICKDGAPGGMGVYEFRDTDLEWYYKGYGEPRDFQLRTYDMNNVKTFFANNSVIRNMIRYYPNRNDYANVGNNVVYINVWGWDPEWKVSVKENGVELNPTRVYMKDPLHTYAYDATRVYKNSNNTYTEVLTSSNNYHLFAANASSATSTLTIEVTDRFGNKYTETMSRPKEFAAQIENL